MEWRSDRRSENIEDRRGTRLVGGGKGIGLGALVLALVAMYFGVDPSVVTSLFDNGAGGANAGAPAVEQQPVHESAEEAELREFVSTVLADTEDVWRDQFKQRGLEYTDPKLVLFRERVDSACGLTSSAVGPFYCPPDRKVYLDLAFLGELKSQLGAPGDFAQAYVIAHEIGHHVQNLLGISDKVHALEQRDGGGGKGADELSVRLELQADFLAGAWAHHADRMKHILEQGDLEEALNAASRIGDDVLQRRATGHVTPDSFTHGTAAQRVRWLKKGMDSGRIEDGDTFKAKEL